MKNGYIAGRLERAEHLPDAEIALRIRSEELASQLRVCVTRVIVNLLARIVSNALEQTESVLSLVAHFGANRLPQRFYLVLLLRAVLSLIRVQIDIEHHLKNTLDVLFADVHVEHLVIRLDHLLRSTDDFVHALQRCSETLQTRCSVNDRHAALLVEAGHAVRAR